MAELAAELGLLGEEEVTLERVLLLLEAQADGDSIKRINRRNLEDAALELDLVVRELLPPLRQVCVMRGCGIPWKRLLQALPGRVHSSVVDDYRTALRLLWRDHEMLVRRLA